MDRYVKMFMFRDGRLGLTVFLVLSLAVLCKGKRDAVRPVVLIVWTLDQQQGHHLGMW